MKIVTGCDRAYAPGARALLNSIRRHSPNPSFDYWCLAYGERELADELEAHGYRVILNPPYPPGTVLMDGGWWTPEQMPAMYARLLLPKLFPGDERVLWLDADIIVKEVAGRTADAGHGRASGRRRGR